MPPFGGAPGTAHLGFPQYELEECAVKKDAWLLCLLCCHCDPDTEQQLEIDWMDVEILELA